MSKALQSYDGISEQSSQPLYETASVTPFDRICDYSRTVLDAVAREIGLREHRDEARVADLDPNSSGPQFLAVYPDGTRIFVGRDETSTDAGIFAFVPGEEAPVTNERNKEVWTVQEALDLLKPVPVVTAESSPDVDVRRQGEWWFVETDEEPAFSVSGQLGSKPYGPSPLENHVAREYGFGVGEQQLCSNLSQYVSNGACSAVFEEVPNCFDAIRNNDLVRGRNWSGRFRNVDWAGIPATCDGVFVRGTVRHRDNEHRMLQLGDSWYRAYTHDKTVYQPFPTTYGSGSIIVSGSQSVD